MLYFRRGKIQGALLLTALLLCLFLPRISQAALGTNISLTITGSSTDDGGGGGGASFPERANVSLSGLAYPFSILTFLQNGVIVGTDIAEPNGTFSREFLVDPGAVTFSIWARDRDGLISPAVSVGFVIEEGALATIESLALPPTIAHRQVGADGSLVIYGSAFPGSMVRLFNNVNTFSAPFETVASADGRWEYRLTRGTFNARNFSYKANYQDEGSGILSPFSHNLELRLVTCLNSDFNGDGVINLTDLSILLFYWGRTIPKTGLTNECVDRNQDQTVDLIDFSILMYEWTLKYQQE